MAVFDEDFDEDDTAAVAQFRRTFSHEDWVDGVSVIQAETIGAKTGFNARFHHIEDDLENVGVDAGQALTSVRALRKDLFRVIREMKRVINQVDAPHADGWQTVQTNWTRPDPVGTQLNPLGFFLDRSGMVQLRGVVTNPQTPPAEGLLLFQLPAARVPENRTVLGAFSGAGTTRVDVQPDGRVMVRTAFVGSFGNFVSLDGLSFRSKSVA